MSALLEFFPSLKPYELALKVAGILAVVFGLMSAGAILMHDRDEARYQRERADAATAAKQAQDRAIAAAVTALQADHARELQAAADLHRQQLQAASLKLAAAQDAAANASAYACKLGAAGFRILMEAFQ